MISRMRWEAGAGAGEMMRSALYWSKNPERRARLYRVGLVRRVWSELPWITRVLTELAERQADGEFDPSSLPRTLEYLAEGVLYCIQYHDSSDPPSFAAYEKYLFAAGHIKPPDADGAAAQLPMSRRYALAWLALGTHFAWDEPKDLSAMSDYDSVPILRDVFGNPFRPVAFSPDWRTDTVLALARQMYDSREFSAMPILADALQDAGCDNDDILSHCRGDGPHVRGCWVVDLVLGKE
jgi:hypothetical protein